MQSRRTRHRLTPTVLVADDFPDIVANVQRRLRRRRYRVVPPVQDLSLLARTVRRYKPQIVLLDLLFGHTNALDSMDCYRRANPPSQFVIYAGDDDPRMMARAFAAGAVGYVLKATPEELFAAIEAALVGDRFIARAMRGSTTTAVGERYLTPDQITLLSRLRSGAHQRDIAAEVGVSLRTCERYVSRLRCALGIARTSYHVDWKRT